MRAARTFQIYTLALFSTALSFSPIQRKAGATAKSASILFSGADNSGDGEFYDDGIGDIGKRTTGDLGKEKEISQSEGSDLARDFYAQVRKREQENAEIEARSESASGPPQQTSESNPTGNLSDKEARFRNREPFVARSQDDSVADDGDDDDTFSTQPPSPTRKFTGQRGPESLTYRSQSLFSSDRSNGGGSARVTPREQMMRQEFDLATRAERGIAVQAAIAVAVLCFYIYVGLTGGIATGEEAINDFAGVDDGDLPIELVIPTQKDREASVWL